MTARVWVRHYARAIPYVGAQTPLKLSRVPLPKKDAPRSAKIEYANLTSYAKLDYLDSRFRLFTPQVNTVLDLGFIPGNWSAYAKRRLCEEQQVAESQFATKCHLLGFDVLFELGPAGTLTIQGDIYSAAAQHGIQNHFREQYAQRMQRARKTSTEPEAYFVKEQQQSELVAEVERVSLHDSAWKPQLILLDLGSPHTQERGFFNNTHSRPYRRMLHHTNMGRVFGKDHRAYMDLAEAALVLACSTLAKNGLFLVRLERVPTHWTELQNLHDRLARVFDRVSPWTFDSSLNAAGIGETFFVCQNKLEDEVDPKRIW